MQIRIEILGEDIDASEFFDNAEDAQDWLIEHTDLEYGEGDDDEVSFCHIGGYELLRDGTQKETFRTVEDLKEFLDDYEIEYDDNITDLWDLAESVSEDWEERYDDGGGSGWIE